MIQSNTIEGNAQGGIMLVGSSATVLGNTVSGNGGTGIAAASDLGEHPDPSMAYDDVIGRPRIGSPESPNVIHGHPEGGVRLEEARAVNSDTLETDNVLGGNGPYEVVQTWLGLAEVFSPSLEPLSGVQVQILGTGGQDIGISGVSNGAGIIGPPGYSVIDARTWWRVPEFAVIEEGGELRRVDMTPHEIRATNGFEATASYSFDAVENDPESRFGMANGIPTWELFRYQVAEVEAAGGPPPGEPSEEVLIARQAADRLMAWARGDGATGPISTTHHYQGPQDWCNEWVCAYALEVQALIQQADALVAEGNYDGAEDKYLEAQRKVGQVRDVIDHQITDPCDWIAGMNAVTEMECSAYPEDPRAVEDREWPWDPRFCVVHPRDPVDKLYPDTANGCPPDEESRPDYPMGGDSSCVATYCSTVLGQSDADPGKRYDADNFLGTFRWAACKANWVPEADPRQARIHFAFEWPENDPHCFVDAQGELDYYGYDPIVLNDKGWECPADAGVWLTRDRTIVDGFTLAKWLEPGGAEEGGLVGGAHPGERQAAYGFIVGARTMPPEV